MGKWKKYLAVVLALVMVTCCLPTMGSNVNAEDTSSTENVYNAASYFAANTTNSNDGTWKYQWRQLDTSKSEYVYTDMAYVSADSAWKDSNASTSIKVVTGDLVITNDVNVMQLYTSNQTMEPVLTYVAPKSGLISISMENGGVIAPATGDDSDAARFSLLYNEETILAEEGLDTSNNTKGNRVFEEQLTFAVTAGDTLRFVVGRNFSNKNISYGVRFNPVIKYVEVYDTYYNAYEDFSTDSNPNGAWSYKWDKNMSGTYTAYTTATLYQDYYYWNDSNSQIAPAKADNAADNALNLKPFNTTYQSVLVFTAPYSGTIEVSMANGGIYATNMTVENGTYYAMKLNGDIKDEAYLYNAKSYYPGVKTLEVMEGDELAFVVQRIGNKDARTLLNPAIEYKSITAVGATYNAYKDYSAAGNPNGVWSYAWDKNMSGTYTPYTTTITEGTLVYWANSGNCFIAPNAQYVALNMKPYNTTYQSVLVFTAPYSGTIEVSMANGGIYATNMTVENGTYYAMKLNGDIKDEAYLYNAKSYYPGVKTIEVKAGDELAFVVQRIGGADARTYLNPQIVYTALNTAPEGITYYVSSSAGNDANAGIVPAAPWKTLSKLKNVALNENDRILLKSGDTFTEQLVLNNVHGTKNYPAVVGSYGDGAQPVISYAVEEEADTDILETAVASVVLNDVEGLEVNGLCIEGKEDGTTARVGIHLAYNNTFNNEYVKIQNCTFTSLTGFDIRDYRGTSDRSNNKNITGVYQMATAITASVNNYNLGVDDPALIGLYIDACTTTNCGTLFAPAFSVYETNEGGSKIVQGMYVTNSTMKDNDYYGLYIAGVQGGYISDCVIDGCGAAEEFKPGTAGVLMSTQDYAIINTEIKNQQRGNVNYDGVAIDLEHLCDNVIIRNNYIHDNTGAGMLVYDSGSGSEHANTNCQVINNVFENNASAAIGGADDPFADIRLRSKTGYAAKDCKITGNSYFNDIDKIFLTYSFISDEQEADGQNTLEPNTELTEKKGDYLENKETVLAIYSANDMFGDYNKSLYKFGKTTGLKAPFATIIEKKDFSFATTFATNSSAMKTLWTPLHYGSDAITELSWDSEKGYWVDSTKAAIIASTYMHPTSKGQTVLRFTAPQTGRICIDLGTLTLNNAASDGTYVTVLDDELQTIAEPAWMKAGNNQVFEPVYVTATKGESVYICLSKCQGNAGDSTGIAPVISYVYNDVNKDASNKLDVCDIVRMKKMISGEETVDTTVADYDGNGTVENTDINVVRQYCVNWWDAYSE